jgi:hypothetical protein
MDYIGINLLLLQRSFCLLSRNIDPIWYSKHAHAF